MHMKLRYKPRRRALWTVLTFMASAGLVFALPVPADARTDGAYPTSLYLGCNIHWDQSPTGQLLIFKYNFGGHDWKTVGQMDSYTTIYRNGVKQPRVDESFNIPRAIWSSDTYSGFHSPGEVLEVYTKIYKHNGDGSVLGEAFNTCNESHAKK